MKGNRSRDTGPELALRREVHRLGLRYYVDRAPLKGLRRRADLAFPRLRIAVFLDGCFWHGCPTHHTAAKANARFWAEKVETNRRRDADTDRRLADEGWTVLRIWEHTPPADGAQLVAAAVAGARSGRSRQHDGG